MKRFIKISMPFLITFCMHCVILSNEPLRAEEAPLRVAVINTGDNPSAPAALLDLLVVHLSQQKGLAVLERQEIAAVLREQGRNLVLADEKSQNNFVAAGRILGADALVLVSAEPPNEQGLQSIEARIVETRRGVRFGETVLMWSEDAQAIARQIQSATEQIASRLGRIQNSKGKFTVVSLAGFRTNELSQEAHRFRRNLESWLESWLASQPGIAVAERTKVLPLIDERKLSSDLPAALGDADITIDGTFTLDFSREQPQVELTLRILRKDRSVATHSLRAPISEQAKLRESAGKAILEMLAIQPTETSFDAEAEAKLLTDEAERLLILGRRQEMLNRLTVAYALEPDNFRIQALLLYAGLRSSAEIDSGRNSLDASFYSTALFKSDIAHQVIEKIEQGIEPPSKLLFYKPENLLRASVDICRVIRPCSEYGVPEQHTTQHEWFRASVNSLYRRCLKTTQKRGGRVYENCLWHGMSIGFYWAKTPEEALALRRNLIERADDLDTAGSMGEQVLTEDFQFRLDRNKAWADRKDMPALLKAHFEDMVASDRILLQARGEKGLAQHALRYLEDRELAIKHYRQFVDLIVNEIIPHYPKIKHDVGGFWLEEQTNRQGDLGLTHEEAGNLWSRVIRAAWSRKCPRSSQPWERRIKATVFHLEKAGQAREADALIQDCLVWLKEAPQGLPRSKMSSQWKQTAARLQIVRSELRVRYPHFDRQQGAILELAVDCQACLTLEQLQPELEKAHLLPESFSKNFPTEKRKQHFDFMQSRLWKFAGITATQEGYVVLCAGDKISKNNSHWQRLVVARLDLSGKFLSASLCPEAFEQTNPEYTELREEVLWPLAATEESLFIAPPNHGVLWYPREGVPVHFSSEHLEKPSPNQRPAPFNHVWQLVPRAEKLYVRCGHPTKPTIYTIDYQQGVTTELLNTQALPQDHPMEARKGFSIMAGSPGNLLFWTKSPSHRLSGSDLFVMNLKDQSLRQTDPPIFLERHFLHSLSDTDPLFKGVQQAIGYGASDGALGIFNPVSQSVDWLVKSKTHADPKTIPIAFGYAGLAANQRYVLASQKKVGEVLTNDWKKYYNHAVKGKDDAPFDWLLYDRANPIPKRLVADNLPPPAKVKQFLINDQNQILMMTSKAVFRIELPADGAE